MCKVSVIVPVYNVELYISRCINSVINQTYRDFDLILVDDGSTDKSGEICDEFAKIDDRIIVIHKSNGGLSDARNVGLDWAVENSKSEYVTFIDSDDWIHKDYIEFLVKPLLNNSSVISACFLKSTTERILVDNDYSFNFFSMSNEEYWIRYYSNSACAKMYKKSFFEDTRFPIGKICEDAFTTPKIVFKADEICLVDLELYYYYTNPLSITHSPWSLKTIDKYEAAKFQSLYFNENHFIYAFIPAYCRYYCHLALAKEMVMERYNDKKLHKKLTDEFHSIRKSFRIPEKSLYKNSEYLNFALSMSLEAIIQEIKIKNNERLKSFTFDLNLKKLFLYLKFRFKNVLDLSSVVNYNAAKRKVFHTEYLVSHMIKKKILNLLEILKPNK